MALNHVTLWLRLQPNEDNFAFLVIRFSSWDYKSNLKNAFSISDQLIASADPISILLTDGKYDKESDTPYIQDITGKEGKISESGDSEQKNLFVDFDKVRIGSSTFLEGGGVRELCERTSAAKETTPQLS